MTRKELLKAVNYVLGEDVVAAMLEARIGLVTVLNHAVLTYFTKDMQDPNVRNTLRTAMRMVTEDGYLTLE